MLFLYDSMVRVPGLVAVSLLGGGGGGGLVDTVKWGNIVIGFNIVTSLLKFLTVHSSLSTEFIGLV